MIRCTPLTPENSSPIFMVNFISVQFLLKLLFDRISHRHEPFFIVIRVNHIFLFECQWLIPNAGLAGSPPGGGGNHKCHWSGHKLGNIWKWLQKKFGPPGSHYHWSAFFWGFFFWKFSDICHNLNEVQSFAGIIYWKTKHETFISFSGFVCRCRSRCFFSFLNDGCFA